MEEKMGDNIIEMAIGIGLAAIVLAVLLGVAWNLFSGIIA